MLALEVSPINSVQFAVNQRVEIALDTSPSAQRFSSRIEGLTEKHMHLAMPMSKAIPVILRPGSKFYGRVVAQGSVWLFTSTFIDKSMATVPLWICEPPYDLKKVQLRSFVRLLAALPLNYTNIEEDPNQSYAATTRDISGGGLQITSKQSLSVGASLQLAVSLPDFGTVHAKATTVRVDQPPETNIYWIAVRFTEIAEKDREKIIKYIFRKQSELRKKGL